MFSKTTQYKLANISWFISLLYLPISVSPSWSDPPPVPETILFREGGKPSISGDGLWVAYQCNNRLTLCLTNTDTGVTEELVTVPAGQILQDVDISRDGMVIAYWLRVGTNRTEELHVYDRNTSSIELISVNGEGEPGAMGFTLITPSLYSEPHLSGNGRYAIFSSHADNLVDETSALADTNRFSDVFIRDRQLGTTERISLTFAGTEGDASSGAWGDPPVISDDGRTAVFSSFAENLTANDMQDDEEHDGRQWRDIFLVDVPSGDIIRVSEVPNSYVGGNQPSENAGLSPNGEFVAFITNSYNLHNGPFSGNELMLYNRSAESLIHVNKPISGEPTFDPNLEICAPEFNFNGNMLFFCSSADNLAPGDGPRSDPDPRSPTGFIESPSRDILAYQNGAISLVRPIFNGQNLLSIFPSSNDLGDVIAFQAAVVQPDQSLVQTVGIIRRGDVTPPVVVNFKLIPDGVVVRGVLLELEAIASDINRGDTDIQSAEFRVNDGNWFPFPARDGTFDNELEILSAFYNTGELDLGVHTICARATDAAGQVSKESCLEFEVVVAQDNQDFMVICWHTPLWPQPGDKVEIRINVVEPPGIDDLAPWFPVERTEIWYNDQNAPADVNDYYGTSSNLFTTEELAAGSFSYGCRARLGDKAIFSGWRTVAVGSPGEDQPIPVIFTGPSSDRVDIVFVADADTYQGANDPDFLSHIEQSIQEGFYRFPIYNRYQHMFNFWLSANTGKADREPGELCTHEKPSDWEENYAFADAGGIIHQDVFRDCARDGMFTFQPERFRTLRHEAGHRPFGLSDEYCCDGGYFEARIFPNVYETETACVADAPNLAREPELCRALPSTRTEETSYTSEPEGDDLMQNNTIPRAADIRRIQWVFDQCAAGLF